MLGGLHRLHSLRSLHRTIIVFQPIHQIFTYNVAASLMTEVFPLSGILEKMKRLSVLDYTKSHF